MEKHFKALTSAVAMLTVFALMAGCSSTSETAANTTTGSSTTGSSDSSTAAETTSAPKEDTNIYTVSSGMFSD